jgi:hypothetical protein
VVVKVDHVRVEHTKVQKAKTKDDGHSHLANEVVGKANIKVSGVVIKSAVNNKVAI